MNQGISVFYSKRSVTVVTARSTTFLNIDWTWRRNNTTTRDYRIVGLHNEPIYNIDQQFYIEFSTDGHENQLEKDQYLYHVACFMYNVLYMMCHMKQ